MINTETMPQAIFIRFLFFFENIIEICWKFELQVLQWVIAQSYHEMAYFKRTNIFQSIVFSRVMALVVLLAIVFMGFALFSIANKSIEASNARKLAESQSIELKQKQLDLNKQLTELNTASGQEALLREQYPVVKPGEHVVVITDTDSGSAAVPQAASDVPRNGFWTVLKGYFK